MSIIERDLQLVRERLAQSRQFIKGIFGDDINALINYCFEQKTSESPSLLVTLEPLIPKERLRALDGKIDTMREWLFNNGMDFTHHPEFAETTEYEIRSFQDCKKLYWHNKGTMGLQADQQPLQQKKGSRLELDVVNPDNSIAITFGFQNDYRLDIEFARDPQSQEPPLYYTSGKKPFEHMSDNHYKIINHYLYKFMKGKHAPHPQRAA